MAVSLSKHHALTDWMHRNDWNMHRAASEAVEDTSGGFRGVAHGAVGRTQLRAILNTARVCTSPGDFESFLSARRERRRKNGSPPQEDFWQALLDHLRAARNESGYVKKAKEALGGALSPAQEMRIIEAYFTHLITHCQLRSKK